MTEDSTVDLYVFGLKSFVPRPINASADLDSTWYDFLNDVCKIRVGPEDRVMACTTSYSPGTRGWCADLSEKIRTFVDKFSIKKNKYSVRLQTQTQLPSTNEESVNKDISRQLRSESNSHYSRDGRVGSTCKRVIADDSTCANTVTSNRKQRLASNQNLNSSNRRHMFGREPEGQLEENPCINAEVDMRDARDDRSVSRLSNNQRGSRIQHDDLKPLVKDRVKRFSNSYLLRVQNEIKKLQNNHLWLRNVQHGPLSAYFLQELFTE